MAFHLFGTSLMSARFQRQGKAEDDKQKQNSLIRRFAI